MMRNESEEEVVEQFIRKIGSMIVRKKQLHSQSTAHSIIKDEDDEQTEYDEIDGMDIQDFLKTASHQKKLLSSSKKTFVHEIHAHSSIPQTHYKYFLMVACEAQYQKLDHPGYYHQLLQYKQNYPENFFACIEKDIPRTLPDGHANQAALRNVLCAYAIRNPSLLYCQGLNYFVCFLLINNFGEEEAFWFLATVIEDVVKPQYFKDLSIVSMASQIFDNLLAEVFPELALEMEENCMESSLFSIPWFVCLFTKGFINNVSQYLLQEIILLGQKYSLCYVLVKISLGIITALFLCGDLEYERELFCLKDVIEQKVQEISLEGIKQGLLYFELDYELFLLVEQHYVKKRQSAYEDALKKELQSKKLYLPKCSPEYPICLHRVLIEKKIGNIEEVLVLKTEEDIKDNYIEDYLVKGTILNINYNKKDCLVGRHNHICAQEEEEETSIKLERGEEVSLTDMRKSKIDERFRQFSSYFIVGDESQEEEEKVSQTDTIEKSQKQENGFSIGNVFRRALRGMKLLESVSSVQ